MDGCLELGGAVSEEFDAVLDAAYDARGGKLFERDRLRGIKAALVDPGLDFVEVDRGHLVRESVVIY